MSYGGATMLEYPPTIFAKDLVRGVTFVVPLAFVNWLPVLRMLGRDDPLRLPGWVDFAGPAVAALCCAAGRPGVAGGAAGVPEHGQLRAVERAGEHGS